MLDYRQLKALATVLQCQSFDKAAARLHLTQSAVSQRVKQLEESVGQLLIIREQPLRPTEAGQQLLRHYHQIALLQSELLEKLGESDQREFTELSIGLNADSLATWFLPTVEPLLKRQALLLELRVDDQDQTHHLLRQGEVSGCISASDKPMQGCSCTELGIMRYRALASPAFIAEHFSDGVTPAAIRRAPAIEFNHKDALQDRYLAKHFGLRSGDYPRHRVPSPEAFMTMIERDLGWGMVPDQQSEALRSNGRLVELQAGNSLPVPLYWHAWNLDSQIGRELGQALIDACREWLEPIV